MTLKTTPSERASILGGMLGTYDEEGFSDRRDRVVEVDPYLTVTLHVGGEWSATYGADAPTPSWTLDADFVALRASLRLNWLLAQAADLSAVLALVRDGNRRG